MTKITEKNELEKYKSTLEEFDVLIHLASKIDVDHDILKSGVTSIDLNISGTLNLLEYLPNLKHICYTSTYMVYGTPNTNPITESIPTEPDNVYGASKLATEKFLQIFAQQRDVKLSILRLMGVYDLEKPYAQAIPSFVKLMVNDERPMIYGTGETRRNHIHVDDVVKGIDMLLNKNFVKNDYLIQSNENISIFKIIMDLNKKLKRKIKVRWLNNKIKQNPNYKIKKLNKWKSNKN